jgi:tetratricopeptide (TPR) repeat protein
MKRKHKGKVKQRQTVPAPGKGIKTGKNNGAAEDIGSTNKSLPAVDKTDAVFCGGVFFITLLVYIFTLAPTVYFGDSGELTAAAYNLGIAHPPGYPLYLLLGKLFMLLVPFGDAAARMNLLSAFFASLTAVLIYLINRALNHGRLISAAVSLTAAFSFTFWTQAVVAEVYTLAALFFCTLILLTLLWLKNQRQLWLLLLALTAGLALTHHVIIALYYPVFLIFILLRQPRLLKNWKLVLKSVSLFLLPLLLYLYLPLRSASNPLDDWGNPETLSSMIEHITAKQFEGLFLKHGLDGVLFQLNFFADTLLKQFPVILLILAATGVVAGLKRQKKISLLFLALLAINISYASAYYITDIEPHFIPIFLLLVLFLGMAFDRLYSWVQKAKDVRLHWLGGIILMIIALLPLGFNWTRCDQSGNYLARHYGQNMLNSLEPKGILFIDGETELFITAYLKIVDGLRPDVQVYDIRQNIFFIPAMKAKAKQEVTIADLYQFARQLVDRQQPVYFTNPVFGNFKYTGYGLLYKVIPGNESPQGMKDPWKNYDLSGLDRTYFDPNAKETQGKYFFSRARYLWEMDQKDLAGEFLVKALSAAGDRYPVLKPVSIFYMQNGRYDQAEKLLRKTVKLDPFDPDGYNMLGMIAHYRSDFPGALLNYNKVLELKENNISALLNRGILYEQRGDREADPAVKQGYYQKAYHDLEQSAKIEPSNPVVANIKSRISLKLSR